MAKGNGAMLLALGGLKKPKGEPAEAGGDDEAAPDLKAEARADMVAALGEEAAAAVEAYVQRCMGGEY